MTDVLAAHRVHIVGIGGAGMSPLAVILLAMGKSVSGSDLQLSAVIASLRAQGATVRQGHRPENVSNADLVVMTSAAREDNPEIQEARRRDIPVIKGSQMLGALMAERKGIAVSGTHGKTTTTAMIALILERAGMDPSFVVGGTVRDLSASGKLGQGAYFVAEADEYDERFLQLHPHIAIVTNIEADHLDFYGNMANLTFAFERFVKGIVPGGWLVACGDNALSRQIGETRSLKALAELREHAGGRGNSVLYGLGDELDVAARNLKANDMGGYDFDVVELSQVVGRFRTQVPGRHNVSNAVAALVAARLAGAPLDAIEEGLESFQGAARRFEVKGEVDGVTVVDDYGHHPTEIKATLQAARGRYPGRRIVAVHQPHTYSRVRNLLVEFAGAFDDADVVLMCDIYASREADTLGVHSRDIVAAMSHPGASYAGDLDAAYSLLRGVLRRGDVALTIGAGDVNVLAARLLASAEASPLSGQSARSMAEPGGASG